MNLIKDGFLAVIGVIGAALAWAFGGWDTSLVVLVWFMVLDFAMGIVVAAVFKKSQKSASGALESRVSWKGLWKKGGTLAVVLVAHWLEVVSGIPLIRDAVIIGFIANETISIVENAGLMGVPYPSVITKAIDVLNKKKDV